MPEKFQENDFEEELKRLHKGAKAVKSSGDEGRSWAWLKL